MRIPKNLPPLCEVLDNNNRILCLMGHKEVLAQKLRHRAYAVMLRERLGRFILARQKESFGFFHYSFLPAGLYAADAAQREIAEKIGEDGANPILCGSLLPTPECNMAITDIYLADLPKTTVLELEENTSDWLFLKRDELFAFRDNDLLDDFLRFALAHGIFSK